MLPLFNAWAGTVLQLIALLIVAGITNNKAKNMKVTNAGPESSLYCMTDLRFKACVRTRYSATHQL